MGYPIMIRDFMKYGRKHNLDNSSLDIMNDAFQRHIEKDSTFE